MAAGQQGRAPTAAWHPLLALPVAAWRLLRVLGHVLQAYAASYLYWPRLDEKGWHDETLRWSRQLLRILGIGLHVEGQARPGAKLVVSNHVSWLDIVAINSVVPSRFVSKAEVGRWPLVGRLVTAAGTLYLIRERRRDAMRVLGLMAQALRDGHTVAVFPEGTTGAGHALLHFHGNLLQSAIDAGAPVQPVVLRYSDPVSAVSPRAAYIGETTLMQSLWRIVTTRGLCIHATILSPQAAAHADRRALAERLASDIGAALAEQLEAAAGDRR
ncbi:MAG: lysophospholipid acyltransferase family protein [Aquabacterium sp.]